MSGLPVDRLLNEDGLPIMEIREELDEEGNVLSTTVEPQSNQDVKDLANKLTKMVQEFEKRAEEKKRKDEDEGSRKDNEPRIVEIKEEKDSENEASRDDKPTTVIGKAGTTTTATTSKVHKATTTSTTAVEFKRPERSQPVVEDKIIERGGFSEGKDEEEEEEEDRKVMEDAIVEREELLDDENPVQDQIMEREVAEDEDDADIYAQIDNIKPVRLRVVGDREKGLQQQQQSFDANGVRNPEYMLELEILADEMEEEDGEYYDDEDDDGEYDDDEDDEDDEDEDEYGRTRGTLFPFKIRGPPAPPALKDEGTNEEKTQEKKDDKRRVKFASNVQVFEESPSMNKKAVPSPPPVPLLPKSDRIAEPVRELIAVDTNSSRFNQEIIDAAIENFEKAVLSEEDFVKAHDGEADAQPSDISTTQDIQEREVEERPQSRDDSEDGPVMGDILEHDDVHDSSDEEHGDYEADSSDSDAEEEFVSRQQIALEYHKLRQKLIDSHGGFQKTVEEQAIEPIDESGNVKKVSRFKAAMVSNRMR